MTKGPFYNIFCKVSLKLNFWVTVCLATNFSEYLGAKYVCVGENDDE